MALTEIARSIVDALNPFGGKRDEIVVTERPLSPADVEIMQIVLGMTLTTGKEVAANVNNYGALEVKIIDSTPLIP